MHERYTYRLALSATINRHNDEEGTEKLFNFFGNKCIEYTLERAISEKKLTPYKYYPIIVTLSYLEKEEQEDLLETIESEDCTPSLAQAIRMKGLSRDNQLDMDKIFEIMTEEKANQKEKLRIPMERVESFFKRGTPPSVMIETVIKALELYRRALNQQKRAEQGNTDRPPEAQKRVKTGDAR